jgi:hypothetical protein
MGIVAEVWRNIEGYEGIYEVSSLGKIRSLDRVVVNKLGRRCHFRGREIKPSKCKIWGYWRLMLCQECKCSSFQVHQLVARAFLGEKPQGKQINHIDGNKDNNAASNLEHVTPTENCNHYLALGLRDSMRGERHFRAKVTAEQVREMRRLRASGSILKDIAEEFDVCISTASKITNGSAWSHVA